jgi:glutamate formiminotransferase/formiminotetrahydrofolate cyclodeaminase
VTFVGSVADIIPAALDAAKAAYGAIDMRTHKGEHPRFGAMDVCPFVPVRNVTMDDCRDLAREMGKQLGELLDVPVYLYGAAATSPDRTRLPDIRQKALGEYEGIEKNIANFPPDFGSKTHVPSWGATAVGARKFLIAYNINLLGTKEQATTIAFNVREKGRGPDKPGRFKEVAGIGWFVEEYNLAQISVNCTDFEVTNIHTVYESCKDDAAAANLAVVGSELVGVVPLACFLDIAKFYMEKEGLFLVDERQQVNLVIDRLGLNSVKRFDPNEMIIDYKCALVDPPLMSLTVKQFVQVLGARTSAPGGGSASALVAAMGSGLGAMMGWMTYGNAKFRDLDADMRRNIGPLHQAMEKLLYRIDADTDAFNDYMTAIRMPKGTSEEILAREAGMQAGLKTAIDVPLETMRIADVCWEWMVELAKTGNVNSLSDLQVGARCLEVGIWGCWKNVEINMKDVKDEAYCARIGGEAKQIWERADSMSRQVLELLEKR